MIVLTGDLHHQSLGTGNQAHCPLSEIQVAGLFVEMLQTLSIPATFFVSGRAFDDEWDELRPIAESPFVEIGGHNYDCFTPSWKHRLLLKATGSYAGPTSLIRADIRKTRGAIERRMGGRLRLWRNHMYMHGPFTNGALCAEGIELVSDGVSRKAEGPTRDGGVWSFPINILPDHEHIYHAERTPEAVRRWVKRYRWSDDFGSESYDIEEWTALVLAQLRANEAAGRTSLMIVHPITMYLADGFRSIERILRYLATCETAHLGSLIPAAQEGQRRCPA